jgi:hypothetical protein
MIRRLEVRGMDWRSGVQYRTEDDEASLDDDYSLTVATASSYR